MSPTPHMHPARSLVAELAAGVAMLAGIVALVALGAPV